MPNFINADLIKNTTKAIYMRTGLDYRYNGRPSDRNVLVTKSDALRALDHYFVELEQETDDHIVLHAYSECDMW